MLAPHTGGDGVDHSPCAKLHRHRPAIIASRIGAQA